MQLYPDITLTTILDYNGIHNISPSSGSLPSVTVLVSFTDCLAFFLDFFTFKKRNIGHKVKITPVSLTLIPRDLRKGAERRQKGYGACILSRTHDFTSKNSNWASDPMLTEPWTLNQVSMLKPRLFISETTSTVQDSLNLQDILSVSNISTS